MTIIGDGFKNVLQLVLLMTFSFIGGTALSHCREINTTLLVMGWLLEVAGAIYFSEKISEATTKWLKKKIEG